MTDVPCQRGPLASHARRRLVAVVAWLVLLAAVPAPAPAAATSSLGPRESVPILASAATPTPSAMAAQLLASINRDRVAAGLRPLRAWTALAGLAGERATRLASVHVLSHEAAGGSVGAALTDRGLAWLGYGEIIGETSFPWGPDAMANLYSLWRASPTHHEIMSSDAYNYVGVGIAQAGDGTTWASVVFTESPDHTPPVAANETTWRRGTSIHVSWSGRDPLLQSHTAGLLGFNVQYRVNGGAWRLIRRLTTSTWLGLTGRQHGSTYSFRVQAVDRRGNLSAWTSEKRVYVP